VLGIYLPTSVRFEHALSRLALASFARSAESRGSGRSLHCNSVFFESYAAGLPCRPGMSAFRVACSRANKHGACIVAFRLLLTRRDDVYGTPRTNAFCAQLCVWSGSGGNCRCRMAPPFCLGSSLATSQEQCSDLDCKAGLPTRLPCCLLQLPHGYSAMATIVGRWGKS
jgi:hypothetical protein